MQLGRMLSRRHRIADVKILKTNIWNLDIFHLGLNYVPKGSSVGDRQQV